MSLINEALKRAEEDKRRNSGDAFDPPALEPVNDRPSRRAGPGGKTLLILLLLASAGGAGWAIYDRTAERNVLRTASADAADAKKALRAPQANKSLTAKPQAGVGIGPVETPAAKPQADRTDQPGTTEKVVADDPDVQLAFARTLEAIRYYKPPRQKAARKKANTKPAKPPKIEPPRFKVSAIVSSPDGASAIINGALIGVGETVGGAKVLRITRTAVELELDGKRLTIRL